METNVKNNIDQFYLEPMKSVVSVSKSWYKNIGFIGKGGNGVTFLVLCTAGQFKGQIFALKVLYRISSAKRIERFTREIEFLQGQNHPSLLQYYDTGVFAKRPFVVMTYLPNTLADEMKKGISLGNKLLYSTQLLSALNFLHNQKTLHRDIKPQNIFINNCTALLGDFGLIKKLDLLSSSEISEDRKLMENVMEKPGEDIEGYVAMPLFYRTPELVSYANGKGGLHLNSDIFQLGLVLAQLFTGRNPLKPTKDLLGKLGLENISNIDGKYGGWIASTIKKMLAINPDKRPSATKLLDDFSGIYEKYAVSRLELDGGIF